MHVTFDPENGEPVQEWDFDPEDVLRSEATAIEKAFGGPWEQFITQLRVRDAKARTVLIWHCMKQDHPRLKFEDTPDFRMRQVKVEMTSQELMDVYQQMIRTRIPEDIKDAFEAAFQRDYQDALEREGKAMTGEVVSATGVVQTIEPS